jgi:hypothetical protein
MDRFSEVTSRCVGFMIDALNEASRANLGDGSDGSTVFVKNEQALQLGKVVTAVGIFSIFEAGLQDGLDCSDGFTELRKILLAVATSGEVLSAFNLSKAQTSFSSACLSNCCCSTNGQCL